MFSPGMDNVETQPWGSDGSPGSASSKPMSTAPTALPTEVGTMARSSSMELIESEDAVPPAQPVSGPHIKQRVTS